MSALLRLEDIDAELSTDAPPSPRLKDRADSFSRTPMPENQPSPTERLMRARQDRASRASRVDSVSCGAEGSTAAAQSSAQAPGAPAPSDAPTATPQPAVAMTEPAATSEAPAVAPAEGGRSSARERRKRVPLAEVGKCCCVCMDLTVYGQTCYTCVKFPEVDYWDWALRELPSSTASFVT